MHLAISGLLVAILNACVLPPEKSQATPRTREVLTVYPDGSMRLNNRPISPEDVVIYPDGYGGERAAVKVRVPVHPDYYRDTIVVRREVEVRREDRQEPNSH
jgi:hypothetical protein